MSSKWNFINRSPQEEKEHRRKAVLRDLEETAKEILKELEAKIPENNLGCLKIDYGFKYALLHWKLRVGLKYHLEKDEFDNFMNAYLAQNSKVYLREPLKLCEDDKEIALCRPYVYYNNLGEVYPEYAYTYLVNYVKKLISEIGLFFQDSRDDLYSCDGTVCNPDLFALIHFGKYTDADVEEMFKMMKIAAKRNGAVLEIIPEPQVFSRSEREYDFYVHVHRMEDEKE